MADKSEKTLRENLLKFKKYKWEFLRRNPNYAKDCETWRGLQHHSWDKNEVVLGYPFRGDLEAFAAEDWKQLQNDAGRYFRSYSDEFGSLNISTDSIKGLKEKGLHPFESSRQGTWVKYEKKWAISHPLNPEILHLPFFIHIAEPEIISVIDRIGCPNGVFENDSLLENGTSSFIKVNWAAPSQYLNAVFQGMVMNMTTFLEDWKKIKFKDIRTPDDLYDKYLQIWDLRQKKDRKGKPVISFKEVAKQVYGKESEARRASDNYDAAEKLIEGGYKEIGGYASI